MFEVKYIRYLNFIRYLCFLCNFCYCPYLAQYNSLPHQPSYNIVFVKIPIGEKESQCCQLGSFRMREILFF